jgi:Sec7-like guanine-nucleotide exchange factor
MGEQQTSLNKLLAMIVKWLRSLLKSSQDKPKSPGQSETSLERTITEDLKVGIKDAAGDLLEDAAQAVINGKAAELASEYSEMLSNLDPKQKELVTKIAIVQSTETGEMDLDEIIEYNELLNECAELNLQISGELSAFWSKIGGIAKDVSAKFVDVGIKVASKALLAAILI